MEIEKKFLIKSLPHNLESYPHDTLVQGYISISPVIRIRQKNDAFILTCKSKGLMIREEFETPLSKDEFESLKKKVDYHLIYKTRYYLKTVDHLTIELDIFHNQLKGLVMAEVEFESIEQCNSFIPPIWFAEEVTQDNRYQNNHLCQLEHIKSLL
jgi:CYTH domain-containing protein